MLKKQMLKNGIRIIQTVVVCLCWDVYGAKAVFAQAYFNYNNSYQFSDEGVRIGDEEFNSIVAHPLGPFDVDGQEVGPFDVKAKVDSEMDYDTNIFWTPNNRKADTINVTSPGVLIDLPLGLDQRHLMQLMYNADIGTFAKYSSQNYVNQYAAYNANFKLPFGYVDVQDDFDHTSDRATTEFTNEVVRNDNNASADVGFKFDKLALETGYSDDWRGYQSDEYAIYDYQVDMLSETAYYQLFPKTKSLIEYDHGWITYDKDTERNGAFDQVRVGLKGAIDGKTEGVLKFGYQDRTYDNSQAYSGFVAEVGTITQLTERTKLSLTYDQSAEESVYENNNYYSMHYFYATLEHKLARNMSLEINSGISRNNYPEVDPILYQRRMDSILVDGIALKYTFQEWASAKLGYTFREDMSNIGTESYTDNLISAGVELSF